MTQQYTPVTWVDETATEPGTPITKSRLDQMQTAHHYADGFEEVDAVPSADPGVSYHKVVYCTADATFYRWDGTQWTKDVDDDTKALLLAHEADHANPHVVTKAQVGLGNVDNKASISAWQSTPDNDHIPTEKLVKDSLDGVDASAVHKAGAETITGKKTIMADVDIGAVGDGKNVTQVGNLNLKGNITIEGDITQNGSAYETHAEKVYTTNDYIITRDGATGALASGDYSGFQVKKYDGINDGRLVIDNTGTARVGDVGGEQPLLTRDETGSMTDGALLKWDGTNIKAATVFGNIGSDTKPIKIVGGVAQAITNDLVDTTSTQVIGGYKTFATNIQTRSTNAIGTADYPFSIVQNDKNDAFLYGMRCAVATNGKVDPYITARNADGTTRDFNLDPANWPLHNVTLTNLTGETVFGVSIGKIGRTVQGYILMNFSVARSNQSIFTLTSDTNIVPAISAAFIASSYDQIGDVQGVHRNYYFGIPSADRKSINLIIGSDMSYPIGNWVFTFSYITEA